MFEKIKDRWEKLDSYTKWAFYIIVLGALIRFILASINYVTGDPCWYVNVVRFIVNYHAIPVAQPLGRAFFWPPPLLEFIGAIFYRFFMIFGTPLAEFSIRLISPVCGVLMLAYSFLIVKKLFNSKIAFYSIIFLTFIPDHIYHSSMFYPDMMVALFVIMSIYYSLENKIYLSGVFMGLSFLTKYNAIFAFPIPFFIIIINNYKKIKMTISGLCIYSIISFAIGAFWFVRNWLIFRNPVYPLFDSMFNPNSATSWGGTIYYHTIFQPTSYLKLYLSFFGVPDGYWQNLFFLKMPFLGVLLAVWFVGTFLFILPAILGLFRIKIKRKSTMILVLWLLPYIFFSFLTLTSDENARAFLSRYLISMFPVIAVLWAFGFIWILERPNKLIKTLGIILFALIAVGFVAVEFAKAEIVKNSWSFYEQDFSWVEKNTPKKAIILVPMGSCYTYNFNRFTYTYFESAFLFQNAPINTLESYNISYVWVNQKNMLYGIEPGIPAIYPQRFLNYLLNSSKLVYENKATNTKIFKIKN